MVDGSLKCHKAEGSIHKVAAKIIGAESCNGWTYWHYISGNDLKPIDNLRENDEEIDMNRLEEIDAYIQELDEYHRAKLDG